MASYWGAEIGFVSVQDVISASFPARESPFTRCSSFSAALLDAHGEKYTRTKGARPRVYFAPLPASCWASLRGRLLVMPV